MTVSSMSDRFSALGEEWGRGSVKVLDIYRGTTVDGPGFRTSIYLAGCSHHCEGCHNPSSWDSAGGRSMSLAEIAAIIEEEDFDVTLTGGDPLYNPETCAHLVSLVKALGHEAWVYTGYTWEQISSDPALLAGVREAQVVVDGPYIASLRDPDLHFRGSSNQRLIDVAASLATGHPQPHHP